MSGSPGSGSINQLHANETIKAASEGLAGSIQSSWESDAATFSGEDAGLIKFHGSYQQDNRDNRAALKRAGEEKDWIFMVRSKIPGGRLTADQYLAHDELSRKHSYGSLRITSRQGFQMHGVGKKSMKGVIKGINDSRLSTLGACGDVNRNVMTCPVNDLDWRADLGMEDLARRIADHFAPRSTAYFEIWCDGEKWGEKITPNREEPLYGKTYLPRKFKMAVAAPEDNCVDIYANDLGAEAVHDGKRLLAWDLMIGGGMGFTHSKEETYPRLGSRLVRVSPAEVLEVIEAVVTIQRDFGGRADRHHARLKYLLDDRGLDWFKEELFRRIGRDLPDAGPMPQYKVEDHLGWHEDRFGKLYLGLPIDSGRIQDDGSGAVMTGLRGVVSKYRTGVRLTPQQNIILTDIEPANRGEIEAMLRDHGARFVEEVSALRRRSIACPALPTCGLALADAERALPGLMEKLEALGSSEALVDIRISGCPNSCVRTPSAEIGVAGRGPGKYAIYLGGSNQGTRLAYKLRETVKVEDLAPMLHELIASWRRTAPADESFGDWSWRLGAEGTESALAGAGFAAAAAPSAGGA